MRRYFTRNLFTRFSKKVILSEAGCWDWRGAKWPTGYGAIRHGYNNIQAHRASWMLFMGAIPKGLEVLHKCDNTSCTNPAHLFLGTQADNMKDMNTKGRHWSQRKTS